MDSQVIYDGFKFADYGIILTNIDHLTVAPRENQLERIANQNGAKLVQSLLGTKPIYLEGYYVGVSPADVQLMYDTLAAVMNRQSRPLIVPHGGGTRQYIATPQNVVIKQPDGLNRITFSFEFVIPDGYSTEVESVTLVDETVTSASASLALTVLGSVTARPLITMTFTSVSGGTGKTVSLRNARDFIGLTFDRDFVSGDVISVDSENFQIYINGVLTEPDGRMPTWSSGAGALYYSDTFTSRSVDIVGTYKPKNL